MKIRTFGSFAYKWWWFYLLLLAKSLRGSVTTFTGSGFLDIVVLVGLLTGILYFAFIISGGRKWVNE